MGEQRKDGSLSKTTAEQIWSAHQDYEHYTEDDHKTWKLLFTKRREALESVASDAYMLGLKTLGLEAAYIPRLNVLSGLLGQLCGWSIMPVSGFLPSRTFFSCLSKRIFPSTTYIRPISNFDYTPEPDIFHDVFGHIPMYWHHQYRDFVQHVGRIASNVETEEQLELIARVYWFTVEFGLVHEDEGFRAYGSGLISSAADAEMALGRDCDRRPFKLKSVLEQEVQHDQLQTVLYVIESYDQLESIWMELEHAISEYKN